MNETPPIVVAGVVYDSREDARRALQELHRREAAKTRAAQEAPYFGFRMSVDGSEFEFRAPTLKDLDAVYEWHLTRPRRAPG